MYLYRWHLWGWNSCWSPYSRLGWS
uniref:Uncharacterized protein n=1 Tax=Anguilla anguilla TaxID=7936 RepID=A0A0E9RZP8_ANGAN